MTLEQLKLIHQHQQFIALPESCRPDIRKSQALVEACANGDAPVYGVNTGFGKLANQRINKEQLHTLQLNLIRSHSVGVGEPLTAPIIRLMMATKAASLARGYSGVREIVIDTLLAVHNAGLVPDVPSQGSVGASGDLAPLAHMTLALLGEGEFVVDGQRQPAAEVLARQAGLMDAQRPDAVARRRATGQRTTRENIDDLVDAHLPPKSYSDDWDAAGLKAALADKLAVMPTRALVATRHLLRDAGTRSLDAHLNVERDTQSALGKTQDYMEGVNAFLEKRPAQFKGE